MIDIPRRPKTADNRDNNRTRSPSQSQSRSPSLSRSLSRSRSRGAKLARAVKLKPAFNRQRSKSAPQPPAIDPTADEAAIICNAAANASDRRRGRGQSRGHISLDSRTKRSNSKGNTLNETKHGSDDSVPRTITQCTGPVEAKKHHSRSISRHASRNASRSPPGDTRTLKNKPSVEKYHVSMAKFLHDRIAAVKGDPVSRPSTPPITMLPDSDLCSSPPPEDPTDADSDSRLSLANLSFLETQTQHLKPHWQHPPLLSAWSSTTIQSSMPGSRANDFPPSRASDRPGNDRITCSPQLDKGAISFFPPSAHNSLPPLPAQAERKVSDLSTISKPFTPGYLEAADTRLVNMTSHNRNASLVPVPDHLSDLANWNRPPPAQRMSSYPSIPKQSPAVQSIKRNSSYFPSSVSPHEQIINAISPLEGASMGGEVHPVVQKSPGHYLVEGQMFEICS